MCNIITRQLSGILSWSNSLIEYCKIYTEQQRRPNEFHMAIDNNVGLWEWAGLSSKTTGRIGLQIRNANCVKPIRWLLSAFVESEWNPSNSYLSLIAFYTDLSWGRPVNVSSYTVVFIYESWCLKLALIAFLCRCAVKQSINQSINYYSQWCGWGSFHEAEAAENQADMPRQGDQKTMY